jgi:hypothetical protein
MIVKIPQIKIEPNGITVTNLIYTDSDKHYGTRNELNFMFNDEPDTYSKFSDGSRRRLKRAFHLLLAIAKPVTFFDYSRNKNITFLLNFITLTLSAKQGIFTDYEIKYKLLNSFLTTLRRKKGLRSYIWRAEPQKNGNIHFHITTNQYFEQQFIRDTWNNCQKQLGFIDLFNEKHHHINPNSTDIHSIIKIDRAGAYIAKYLSKISDDSRKISGKIWDCSQNLKLKDKCQIIIQGNGYAELERLEQFYEDRLYISDYFKFIPMDKKDLANQLPALWAEKYNNYLNLVASK